MSLVDIDPEEFAERHRSALFAFLDHVLTHANYAYTSDFEAAFKEVLATFDAYVRPKITGDPPPDMGLEYFGRSHNFVTAQCSLLLLFAHEMSRRVDRKQLDDAGELLAQLWKSLAMTYEQFFGTIPPYLLRLPR